ncbi:MAG: carboxypeptidase regulatory-like domain-containing protein [Terriglobales bacterium]
MWISRNNPKLRRPVSSLVFTACLFVAVSLFGQNPNGALRGEVEDTSGARIAGAHVSAQSFGSSLTREIGADERGEFRLEGLLPGRYHVVVTAKGFADAASDVEIAVSLVRDISVTLKPQSGRESVSVEGKASSITTESIDTASAVHQGIVTTRDLETLPLAARSFANIAYLVPGTEPVEPSDPTKARITAVSTGGSSGLNNELSVDGADNSDDWIGGFLQNFSPDGIQEFAVRTANEDADSGGTTAGSVVITTKHGTNDWHGSAAFYDRQAALNARFPIENPAETCTDGVCVNNPKQPFSRQNYVGTLGGPIAKNKVWVFASFEHVHENASIAYSPASSAQFNALATLAADGLIDVNGTTVTAIPVPATVPIPFRDYNSSLRFDWAQSSKSQWFLRTSQDSYLTHNNLVQQATLPSTGLTTHNNYSNTVLSNTYSFSPTWVGTLVLDASLLHLTQARNSNLGFALQFPFSVSSLTVSGHETFGDNQFATPITLFPSLRNQDKYQFRYDLSHVAGSHALKFGVNFIHEPVLSGAFAGNAETLVTFPNDPTFYTSSPGNLAQFPIDLANGQTTTPAGDGSFSQNVQRLGLYAQDSWRVMPHLTVNYGLRYQTTFGLFQGSGRSLAENAAYVTLQALQIPLVPTVPHDYRKQIAPRLGIAYSPGGSEKTVIRAAFGMFYNDLAQNGWATAFQGVNNTNAVAGTCALTGGPGTYALSGTGCLTGGNTAAGNLIGSNYKTPYAIHITGGVQHVFNQHWTVSADYAHEQGNHGYRGYAYTSDDGKGNGNLFTPLIPTSDPNYDTDQANVVPNLNLFNSDNRSSYNALMIVAQGNVARRFNLIAHYTLSRAQTWGCFLGELFDYVNGVCDPLHPFAPGDYGPSGEDVTHRFVLAGTLHIPGGVELTTITQAESARPITLTTPVGTRAVVNGNETTLDQFRGTPYVQSDLRVSRPIKFGERWRIDPFAEFFNLFNRNNPGANYVTDISALPNPVNDLSNATMICSVPAQSFALCPSAVNITNPQKQLLFPAGGLGDFFGPGTTVGIPFAAQLGVRVTF